MKDLIEYIRDDFATPMNTTGMGDIAPCGTDPLPQVGSYLVRRKKFKKRHRLAESILDDDTDISNKSAKVVAESTEHLIKLIDTEFDKNNYDLTHIDVSKLDNLDNVFSKVIFFRRHNNFKNCTIDVSNWDVSNVKSLDGTFKYCDGCHFLTADWDVSNVVNMDSTFETAESTFDISNWDTHNVRSMRNTFCGTAHNFDVSDWDVSNVVDMWEMFDTCIKFNCDLSKWDVSKVTNMEEMFRGCQSFDADLSSWKPNLKELNADYMFVGSKLDKDRKLPEWFAKYQDYDGTFKYEA